MSDLTLSINSSIKNICLALYSNTSNNNNITHHDFESKLVKNDCFYHVTLEKFLSDNKLGLNENLTADRTIFNMMDELLSIAKLNKQLLKQQLTQIAIISGPGSFTGLRLGYAFAFAISKSYNIPVCSLNTFQILAAEMICHHKKIAKLIWQNKAFVLFFAKSYRNDFFVMLSNLKSPLLDKKNNAITEKLDYNYISLKCLNFNKSNNNFIHQKTKTIIEQNFIINYPYNYSFDSIINLLKPNTINFPKLNPKNNQILTKNIKNKKIFVIGEDASRFMECLPKKINCDFELLKINSSFNYHLSLLANKQYANFNVSEPDYLRSADFSTKIKK